MHRVFDKKNQVSHALLTVAQQKPIKREIQKRGHTPIKSPIHSIYTLGVWIWGGGVKIYCDCEEGEISCAVALLRRFLLWAPNQPEDALAMPRTCPASNDSWLVSLLFFEAAKSQNEGRDAGWDIRDLEEVGGCVGSCGFPFAMIASQIIILSIK